MKNSINIDQNFCYNIQNAIDNNINVGVYHYSYAVNEIQARNEANFVIEIIGENKLNYPIALDFEDSLIFKNTNIHNRNNIIISFCEQIKKYGFYPIIFCDYICYNLKIEGKNLSKSYDFWISSFNSNSIINEIKPKILRYTNMGKINGIQNNVGLNRCFIDYSKIINLIY